MSCRRPLIIAKSRVSLRSDEQYLCDLAFSALKPLLPSAANRPAAADRPTDRCTFRPRGLALEEKRRREATAADDDLYHT